MDFTDDEIEETGKPKTDSQGGNEASTSSGTMQTVLIVNPDHSMLGKEAGTSNNPGNSKDPDSACDSVWFRHRLDWTKIQGRKRYRKKKG